MKVLLIDDEEDIRRIAALSLEIYGKMEVIEAADGKQGLEMAKAEQPDVILLDVMMPDMDGPATLTALSSDPATESIPVIFLTAKAMPSEVTRLKALGVKAVITKPFDLVTLSDQVRKILDTVE